MPKLMIRGGSDGDWREGERMKPESRLRHLDYDALTAAQREQYDRTKAQIEKNRAQSQSLTRAAG